MGASSERKIRRSTIDAAFRPLFNSTHPTILPELGACEIDALFHARRPNVVFASVLDKRRLLGIMRTPPVASGARARAICGLSVIM